MKKIKLVVRKKELAKHLPEEKPDNRMIVVYLKRSRPGNFISCRWSQEGGWNKGGINESDIDFWVYMADALEFHNKEKKKVK